MAQPVKHLTLDFCSGRDLTVCEFEPHLGLCADSVEPAWNSLSPSLSPSVSLSLSLKINKLLKIDKQTRETEPPRSEAISSL